MINENFVWKCKCGYIEHSELPPEDCPECLRINKFKKVPDDQMEEAREEEILSTLEEDEE